jgi:hypothetical protein
MFERYDEHARRVIFFARYEASQSGSQVIGALHMLLGLLRESGSIFTLAVPDFSVDDLVAECRRAIPMEEKTATSVDMPLSNDCKYALAAAAEQAELMKSRVIQPLHIAIGLMSASQEVAALLNGYGITAVKLGASPEARQRNPESRGPHSALLEFVCEGERVATSPLNFVNPLPRTGDEIYLTRNGQAETYQVLRVQHHFEGPPATRTMAHCWLVKVVIEVEAIGIPHEITGDT